jgi:sugar phosphate isomerase/epimerase
VIHADISFIHTLRDTIDLATQAGIGVCLDMKTCWWERGLRETISGAAGQIGLVQLSDYLPGRRAVDSMRAVPGDGVVPLERHVGWILETGYAGLFDLELGYEPDLDFGQRVERGATHVGGMIDRLSAPARL